MNIHSRVDGQAEKKEQILEAALEAFADRGFHGTTVPAIAERAGVAAGTLYRYFESKEAIVNALYQHWKRTFAGALMVDFPAGAPPREQFRSLWERLCRFAEAHPLALQFLELHHHAPYLDETSRRIDDTVLGPARAFLAAAQRQMAVKPLPPDLLIALVHGAFVGVLRAARDGLIQLGKDTTDAAESCLWEAIRR